MSIEVLVIVALAVAAGYNLKPVVLIGMTVLLVSMMGWAGVILATEDLELGAVVPLVVIVSGLWFLIPMWIARLAKVIKRANPGVSFWSMFKGKVLDTKK